MFFPMARIRSRRVEAQVKKGSVVERAIAMFDGNAAEFQRKLEQVSGKKFDRSQVFYWRVRGKFPPGILRYVQSLTRIPFEDLLEAHEDEDAPPPPSKSSRKRVS